MCVGGRAVHAELRPQIVDCDEEDVERAGGDGARSGRTRGQRRANLLLYGLPTSFFWPGHGDGTASGALVAKSWHPCLVALSGTQYV